MSSRLGVLTKKIIEVMKKIVFLLHTDPLLEVLADLKITKFFHKRLCRCCLIHHILRSLTADQSVPVSTGVNQSEARNLSLGQSEDSFRG